MANITLTIDNKTVTVPEGTSILDAALANGIYIPHLCHHEDLHENGGCRLCVVKVEGCYEVVTACSTMAKEGMVVNTKDEEVEDIRKLSMDLMFSTHPGECVGCPKYGKCQLASILQYQGDTGRQLRDMRIKVAADETNPLMLHEMYRCILCGRCVRACQELRGVGALKFDKVDGRMRVVVNGNSLEEAGCKFCGACVEVCPTGSIRDKVGVLKENVTRKEALIPCETACPAHINVPKYIRFIKEGKYAQAAAVVREKAPLPETLGYICVHTCELECKRNHLNGPLSIRNLKRYAAACDDGSWKELGFKKPDTGKKVAVIGSGPAGLTAAYYLRKLGHAVTIYESLDKPGGQLRYGIPSYRLPREVLDREISEILEVGIELKCGEKKLPKDLKSEGYDAVFTAIGTHVGSKLPIPGNDLPEVYVNADFLRASNTDTPLSVGEKVVILGGGNVAIDCAETAVRLGAKEVHMACLESAEKMTASEEEIEWAKEDGIIIHNSKTFNEIVSEDGHVAGLSITGIKDFRFENGKAVIEKEEGSDEILPCDTVIFAVGQKPDASEEFGLEMFRGCYIVADKDTGATSEEGIYAAGDCVTGTKSVIDSIAEARKAVTAIDIYLGGDGAIDEELAPEQFADPCIGRMEGFVSISRQNPNVVDAAARKCSFAPMDLGFDKELAACEADRCLQCDLREKLAPQKFWGDYTKEEGGDN